MYKRGLSIALIAVALIGMTGCGTNKDPLSKLSSSDLIKMANEQSDKLKDNEVRIVELETLLKGIQGEEAPTAAISTLDDGTGRLTFNSIEGKIVFPVPFEYPDSGQAPNTSSVNITSNISISPTNNWILISKGTELDLQHTSGVFGVIKVGYIKKIYDRDKMQSEVMSKFFVEFPPEKIVYSKLFLNNQWWGLEGKTPTTLDKEPAYLRCGMLGLGDQCFTYMFIYKGKQDADKDETVVTLLKTMKMLGQSLRIE